MLFNSAVFIFLFLPIVLCLYYIFPSKYRNLLIFIASLIFYSWGEKELVLIMIASSVTDFFAGIIIEQGKKKTGLVMSLIVNLGLLTIFKYLDFIIGNINYIFSLFSLDEFSIEKQGIILPIGISFYTFQTMSYTIDVYFGKVKATRNFINFGAYVTMFPQLIAGPIVRYIDIHKQLEFRNHSIELFSEGAERFIIGLSKKMIFANSFGYVADSIFVYSPDLISTPVAWIGILAYSLQIYFDFSAYSDMAIGIGKMFGFKIPENFNYPYISKSIKEFWRRWHISLSTWFRDYLYIPLGGNRISPKRTYLNLLIVFFITGLWHGSSWNFIFWGLFHGLFLALERLGFDKILQKIWIPIQHIYTLFIVLVGWVFFRAETLEYGLHYVMSMFGMNSSKLKYDVFLNSEIVMTFILGIILSTPIFIKTKSFIIENRYNSFFNLVYYLLIFFLLFISIGLIAANSYNPFIYFRF